MNILKLQPASYYKAIYNNNLQICGYKDEFGKLKMEIDENGSPVLIGNDADWTNFERTKPQQKLCNVCDKWFIGIVDGRSVCRDCKEHYE
jgi:hypothetical protein